ncbi:hypothetical protein [Flavobacterium sp. TSSA_36]|uniref:hypothetical protein n=1 Tax=Flavobacterium sp. TSSA_36 TaxID=3447669 RepID=UPI003F3BD8D0
MHNKILLGILGVALLFFLGSATPPFQASDPTLIINKIEITINGQSTVGKYSCGTTFYKNDTLVLNVAQKNSLKAEIPMVKFDCGNKIMTKDLQGTVKADQFPFSVVTLSNIRPFGNHYKCNLNFCIVTKTLVYKDFILTNTNQKLQGAIALQFTDIGLSPPVKMGGLIKVNNQVTVNFSLYKK